MAIDYWAIVSYSNPWPHNAPALFVALAVHFTVAGYYYQLGEKKSDDRPYQIYGFMGAIFPYLAIFLVEELKGKARNISDNIVSWSFAIFGVMALIAVFVSYFI
jgi:hypothetical protein